ncbi:MAG: 2-C-methyl-D-erythritol 4-phosphate cytidylyltransferase [Actinomycetaceae bacterium]|nr:2-C-methyl-D-erythritol 4-phosphate cytidylyltransferase [Actinomycetaceae bacterium]
MNEAVSLSAEQLQGMQNKSWQLYEYFADFCDRHGLLYYACGGCCIGAVRDGGFVPWDDDIDVFMPRQDYERLQQLWETYADTTRYEYVRTNEHMVTGDLMAKICDKNTTLVTTYQVAKRMPQGLTMDILPLDGCPKPGSLARKYQKVMALIFSLFCSQTVPERHGGIMAFGSKMLLTLVASKKLRYRIWRFAERQMTKWAFNDHEYTTELCAGPGYMRNEYRQEWFASATTVPFDDSVIAVPVGYDGYLSMAFGDYMTPPPQDKRKPSHEVAFIDLEMPYSTYMEDGIFKFPVDENK